MVRKTYNVPDVSCNHCKMNIERALGGLTGVFEAEVDVPAKTVAVAFDDEVISEEAVLEMLAEEGYPVAA
ncbi:MAG: heavy-metal-associated domain-containing protein [Actinobacteria bacterium]|nr:heavy-metal-associated domain-containing protein [Actinomycetota bacterium]